MKLPEGYKDQHSGYYVPEELRDIYEAEKPLTPKQLAGVIERHAKKQAAAITEGQPVQAFWNEVDRLIEEGDSETALHAHYLNNAEQNYLKNKAYLERTQAQLENSRCPVCNSITQQDPANPLTRRSLRLYTPQLIEQPGDLYSCLKCYLVALDLHAHSAATEKMGKATRLDLVTKVLR